MAKILRVTTCVECPVFSAGYRVDPPGRVWFCRNDPSHRVWDWPLDAGNVSIPSWCSLPEEEEVEWGPGIYVGRVPYIGPPLEVVRRWREDKLGEFSCLLGRRVIGIGDGSWASRLYLLLDNGALLELEAGDQWGAVCDICIHERVVVE